MSDKADIEVIARALCRASTDSEDSWCGWLDDARAVHAALLNSHAPAAHQEPVNDAVARAIEPIVYHYFFRDCISTHNVETTKRIARALAKEASATLTPRYRGI